ncbi:hypothetical protein G6F22_015502 [Rhizopus arrhizus]|nr:hypothetical protein G6F22_015502 [Rhizopus arrhizus]
MSAATPMAASPAARSTMHRCVRLEQRVQRGWREAGCRPELLQGHPPRDQPGEQPAAGAAPAVRHDRCRREQRWFLADQAGPGLLQPGEPVPDQHHLWFRLRQGAGGRGPPEGRQAGGDAAGSRRHVQLVLRCGRGRELCRPSQAEGPGRRQHPARCTRRIHHRPGPAVSPGQSRLRRHRLYPVVECAGCGGALHDLQPGRQSGLPDSQVVDGRGEDHHCVGAPEHHCR